MNWFGKSAVVEDESAPSESPEQKRARLHGEWRRAEDDFNLAFERLTQHDAQRIVLVGEQARCAEIRNRKLAALAVVKKS
jgi:hypothetical protein